jgi:adenosylmethionine---8-amino-7-oxononanoate aminotransferase
MAQGLSARDKQVIWHPFTPQYNLESPLALVRGKGTLLIDETGKEYIDAIASWWVNLHGHAHPYIASKISEQVQTLEHAIFSGYTHRPAIELAERLLVLLPNQKRIFYSDDGSTSVEVGLKMAFQHWHNSGKPRTKIIAFENAYHGDTFGGMSVGARNVFSRAFEKMLFEVVHIPVPVKGKEEACKLALQKELPNAAAFIFEPLVQGAAGMIMYDAFVLNELMRMCKEADVFTIADEVMTGFGRTGKFFATDYCEENPDIICLSKGLTGGFLPLGATLCTEKVYSAFLTADRMQTFFHGHSYTANPTACAAAIASLDLFEKENTFSKINKLANQFILAKEKYAKHQAVIDARCMGGILALEIRTESGTNYLNPMADQVHSFFQERGIILRPLGNIIYLIPPYCITEKELQQVFEAIDEFLVRFV